MSQYKVPQDVEADDKLLGPFTFRQLIYLFVTAGLCVVAYFLARILIVLVIIPVPFILFFGALALPLKKDQPMETYLTALISYYLKPHNRFWNPGQRESTIEITVPKIVEEARTRSISGDEASHRLSFLANIIDTEGHAIRDTSTVRDELIAEADSATDIFESSTPTLDKIISTNDTSRHTAAVNQMKAAIEKTESLSAGTANGQLSKIAPLHGSVKTEPKLPQTVVEPTSSAKPITPPQTTSRTQQSSISQPASNPKPEFVTLANDAELSIETIAKQAKRISKSNIDDTNETFISLH